ncbi:transmembrane protein 45A isoform X1 [Arapaima gigas]
MANFKGHALPGTFFLIGGLWWAVKYSLYYATRKNRNLGCLASKAVLRRLEIFEGSVMLSFSLIGMLAEQFVPDGPQLRLYDYGSHKWDHLMNWQHATMYLFFGLAGATSLAVHLTDIAPQALDRMLLGIALFIEGRHCSYKVLSMLPNAVSAFSHGTPTISVGFLFLYHLHGRDMLDVHVHQLLLYATFGGALTTFLEIFHRGNILLELLRATLATLQGTWFWQIGFVLYPPAGMAEWNLSDHNNMTFITMCYCWHFCFSLFAIAGVYGIVSWVVRSRLKRTPTMEMGLLKTMEREQESEDEL